ncbi:MAG: type 1 glutamine amidotransferase domain-containing protein [Candidatus Kapaibacterium sp.]
MQLKGKKIAIFVEKLYEDIEFWYPYFRMQEAGADVDIIAPDAGEIYEGKHGMPARSDKAAKKAKAKDYEALIIPGGYSPDHMRRSKEMVDFVREMHEKKKIVAAICHGPWMLASAGILSGKEVTSFHSIKDDLINAGAKWEDNPAMVDNSGIITSRNPHDLPYFCASIINQITKPEL